MSQYILTSTAAFSTRPDNWCWQTIKAFVDWPKLCYQCKCLVSPKVKWCLSYVKDWLGMVRRWIPIHRSASGNMANERFLYNLIPTSISNQLRVIDTHSKRAVELPWLGSDILRFQTIGFFSQHFSPSIRRLENQCLYSIRLYKARLIVP